MLALTSLFPVGKTVVEADVLKLLPEAETARAERLNSHSRKLK